MPKVRCGRRCASDGSLKGASASGRDLTGDDRSRACGAKNRVQGVAALICTVICSVFLILLSSGANSPTQAIPTGGTPRAWTEESERASERISERASERERVQTGVSQESGFWESYSAFAARLFGYG